MKIEATEKWLPVYKALASEVRLKIIQLLAKKSMNIKELAATLGLSSAIMTMHIKKLEEAKLITTKMTRAGGGTQKICTLTMDKLEIEFPKANEPQREFHHITIPIGHYTDFEALPTCGLATREKVIGHFDDSRYFLDPERVDAKIIWFAQGYLHYRIPNYMLKSQEIEELEISMELGSEAPGVEEHWPSDISFFMNNVHLGHWTSPGDYGGKRGKYTPSWWNININQFGLLKVLRINSHGTFIDGVKISGVTLDQLDLDQKQWSLRIGVAEDAQHVGGLTLFGSGFGNYDQDIVVKVYYLNERVTERTE